jgi:phage-related protein
LRPNFAIELLPDAVSFMDSVDEKAREKIYFNMRKAQHILDNEIFKKISDTIWEFRTMHKGQAYRLFAFWDKTAGHNTLVVATHGIIKKNQRTPLKEIRRADSIRKLFLENKLNKN